MAFPSLAAAPTATQFGTAVTSMSVNLPSSISAGDLLIASVETRNNATFATPPTGWTALASQQGGGSAGYLRFWYKIATGSEGSTASWTASISTTAVWQTFRVTSWHGTTPPEITTSNGDSSAANPPSLTPSWGTVDTLWFAIAGHAAVSAAAFTAAPTNYSGFQNNGASSGGSAVSIANSYRQLNAASEDPGAFTAGGSNRFWAAATVAIRPAAASGVTVTPSLASISTSTFAPTVQLPKLVVAGVVSLVLSTFAATVSASDNQVVIPSLASISTSGLTPSVFTSNNITVVPNVTSVSASTYSPTASATDNVAVVPDNAGVASTAYQPIILLPVVSVPGAVSLVTSQYSPGVAVSSQQIVTPNQAHLTASLFAPSVTSTNHISVTPNVANLGTTSFSPTVFTPVVSLPSVVVLPTSTFASSVAISNNITVTPSASSLSLTLFSPAIVTPVLALPPVASLSLLTFVPTIITAGDQSVTPLISSLHITGTASSVVATNNQVATPGAASMFTTKFAPVIAQVVVPSTRTFVATSFVPNVMGIAHVTVEPTVAQLAAQRYQPLIRIFIEYETPEQEYIGVYLSASVVAGEIEAFTNTNGVYRLGVNSSGELEPSVIDSGGEYGVE